MSRPGIPPLPAERLYRVCDPESLPFQTTAELPDTDQPVGQDRAVESIRFAIGMTHRGFNLFALGPEGTGRRSLVMQYLAQAAAGRPRPDDWVYVNNFKESHKPRVLRLPPGSGRTLKKDMEELVEELGVALPAAFDSEEYANRRRQIDDALKTRQDEAFDNAAAEAAIQDISVMRTPVGLTLAPTRDGEVLTPDAFKQLPEEEQDRRKADMEELQARLEEVTRQMPQWERETRAQLRALDTEVVDFAISHLMDELREKYAGQDNVLDHLAAMAADVAENAGDFIEDEEDEDGPTRREITEGALRRYRINVLVDNGDLAGAPVVYEDHPTQPNVVGRIEHLAHYGALITDFNLIKPGSLHKANGGYLVMDARKLLLNPFAWEDLKRALKARLVRIESPGQSTGLWTTMTLEPEAIPLDIKVVLIGDPMLYYMLSHNDPEFAELFKVAADFDWRMDWTEANVAGMARSLATLARKDGLRPLDRAAVARVVEQAARDVEDSEKLSTHMADVADVVREADYWAGQDGAAIIGRAHVQKAIDSATYRHDRVREHVQEEMRRGIVHVVTDGAEIGQINALTVLELGNFAFGRPSRLTATVSFGKGDVLDIEREVALGGPLYGKGVMILTSFLAARFGQDGPLSLFASLVVEQSYGEIEGDSASSTELYALMSAMAELPIDQGLAVTGSVDQFGRIQAIGGVNEKIEGFFDLCAARGLTGRQGVLIPATNVPHLMLRHDVVEACRKGLFAIYPVEHVDQGIELLTGVAAGVPDQRGQWPAGSVNRRIQARLIAFARRAEDMTPRPVVVGGGGGRGKL